MAKEKFNLGKLLAENVSDLNTLGRDQIEYIDLDKLNGDSPESANSRHKWSSNE